MSRRRAASAPPLTAEEGRRGWAGIIASLAEWTRTAPEDIAARVGMAPPPVSPPPPWRDQRPKPAPGEPGCEARDDDGELCGAKIANVRVDLGAMLAVCAEHADVIVLRRRHPITAEERDAEERMARTGRLLPYRPRIDIDEDDP